MAIIRTIIWVALTAVLIIFSMANWNPITVNIWPGQVLDTKLPLVILVAFLVGFLPTWFAFRATRWSLKRRLDSSERQLADLRAMATRSAETPALSPSPAPADQELP